ncbi:NUP160 [Branchiostoma lanceolatum]|uniref:NUP160 protein n=1 Tax=Branchiostoma lanceolatum TaxID=7740 RepID=A0A8J9ZM05_BRALA|nr:NUP160 [Branchiostoma lanceolatum]
MAGRALSFCEVPLNLGEQQRWKELTVNLGGGGSQDIKLPERGGGFSYKDGGRVGAGAACNRLIYWRSYGDTLELVELSGNANLDGNAVRIRFPDSVVVPCVGIHETHAHVVVLFATVCSVHRIVLPHPSRIARMDYGGDYGIPSVFADLSLAELRNEANFHLLNQSPSNYPHLGATWLTNEGEGLFAMATIGGSILLVKLPQYGIQGIVSEHELRQASMMQRLWTGWVPSVIRGGQESSDATLDLCVHRQDSLGHDNFVFAVCRDHKLRMWSTNFFPSRHGFFRRVSTRRPACSAGLQCGSSHTRDVFVSAGGREKMAPGPKTLAIPLRIARGRGSTHMLTMLAVRRAAILLSSGEAAQEKKSRLVTSYWPSLRPEAFAGVQKISDSTPASFELRRQLLHEVRGTQRFALRPWETSVLRDFGSWRRRCVAVLIEQPRLQRFFGVFDIRAPPHRLQQAELSRSFAIRPSRWQAVQGWCWFQLRASPAIQITICTDFPLSGFSQRVTPATTSTCRDLQQLLPGGADYFSRRPTTGGTVCFTCIRCSTSGAASISMWPAAVVAVIFGRCRALSDAVFSSRYSAAGGAAYISMRCGPATRWAVFSSRYSTAGGAPYVSMRCGPATRWAVFSSRYPAAGGAPYVSMRCDLAARWAVVSSRCPATTGADYVSRCPTAGGAVDYVSRCRATGDFISQCLTARRADNGSRYAAIGGADSATALQQDQECVAEADLLDYVADKIDQQTSPGQSHMIQKAFDSQTHSLYLVAFLSFADRSMFVVVQPVLEDGRYHFLHMATLCSPQEKLIGLHLDPSTLWTVWTNSYDETVARYCSIESGQAGQQGWSQVILEPAVSPEVTVPNHQDPSEAYLEHIFYPGRFSLQTIAKALHIYRRSVDVIADLSAAVLKEQVSLVVESEIQNAVTEYEVQQEEYYQVQLQSWNKFYMCCTQYHQVAARPLGVYSDEDTAMVCLVKKYHQVAARPLGIYSDEDTAMVCLVKEGAVSFLRPCDGVEHLYLAPQGVCQPQHLSAAPFNIADYKLCRDIVLLGDCLRLIRDQLTPDVVSAVEQDLFHLETPQNIVEPLVNNVISEAGDVDQSSAEVISTLESSLQTIIDAPRAIDTVLQAMDVTGGDPENLAVPDLAAEPLRQLSLNHVFGSAVGHAVLESSARQLATTRLAICRDLLLLQGLMGRMGQRASLSQDSLNKLQSDLIPRTAQLMQVYYVITWVAMATYTHVPSNSLDMNLRQLQAMDISDLGTGLPRYLMTEGTLLALFLHGVGGQQLGSLLAGHEDLDQDPCALWAGVLQTAVLYILQLLYPMSPSSLLPEFLMTKCQYLQLQEYVRLLDSWCVWNTSSRRFFLGAAHLNCGEPHKAVDCFLQGVHGVGNEDFLLNKLLQPTDQELPHLPVLYLVKVLRLLEQFEVPELVISLANSAIGMAQPDDPNIPMLWSKVFKYHLELGHNNEAYAAMTANPDHTRRKDCLRQFIVILCERSQLQTLVEFPYVGLHDEVVYIIESRARSVDLTAHNYYDLLYAFHIYRGSYRKAGSTMYEYGLRLGRELPGVKSLQKQAKCYLAAINTLRLVDPKYAWIVKPVRVETATEEGRVSPKRDYSGDHRLPHKKKQVEILELSELEKEYMVVLARLHLIQKDPDPAHATGPPLSAEETVALLVQAGLFDNAVSLSQAFRLSLVPVFEGLASKCVRLTLSGPDVPKVGGKKEAFDWLGANDIPFTHTSKPITAADQAWQLLQIYLERFDIAGVKGYHKSVANKLLSLGAPLPTWLVRAYKEKNASELLRLYLNFDLLEEACHLVGEYIDAVLGKGTEYFGLKSALHATSPSVWLPYTAIDHLLYTLRTAEGNSMYAKLHMELCDKLQVYHRNVERVSQDMVQTALQKAARHSRQDQSFNVSSFGRT